MMMFNTFFQKLSNFIAKVEWDTRLATTDALSVEAITDLFSPFTIESYSTSTTSRARMTFRRSIFVKLPNPLN